ncbi:hypothetical protein [Parasitella parasitica]|uniref:MYND-type domain-containing protein n=1 Tax=Parasitella parasitica TaxID=35722 RepID=A0A0B7NDV2_9FUNG|nr:hypothetical protein [Parasitella parasitica]
MYSPKILVPTSITESKLAVQSFAPIFTTTNHYRQQLNIESIRQHSLKDAVRLASQVNMKHDTNGCDGCDLVAGYYMTALKYARESEPIQCNSVLFDLTWQMTNLVLSHRETSTYQYLHWFDLITAELWEFAKQLKEESFERDLHVALSEGSSIDSLAKETRSDSGEEHEEETYLRAIRITIYNCRALVCEQSNEVNQAIVYYRKCASVRPTPFELQQHLQQTALATMQRLMEASRFSITHKLKSSSTFTLESSTSSAASSSVSSSSNSRTVNCSCCGIEKSVMPVCSRCRSQPYCSVRCVKAHKLVHQLSCCPSSSSS